MPHKWAHLPFRQTRTRLSSRDEDRSSTCPSFDSKIQPRGATIPISTSRARLCLMRNHNTKPHSARNNSTNSVWNLLRTSCDRRERGACRLVPGTCIFIFSNLTPSDWLDEINVPQFLHAPLQYDSAINHDFL